MRVLLISTYELGHQPVHVTSPAAALREAGHETTVLDLAVDDLSPEAVDGVDAVALSVPMHTATRLALMAVEWISGRRPGLPIALYGLYAAVPEHERSEGVDAAFAGEYEPDLLDWVGSLDAGETPVAVESSRTGRSDFVVPDRSGLPALERYARLEHDGGSYLAGAVEASHGCRHRCRHCPIPSVYDGRLRIVPSDVVLADIDQLVASGARHITFGDPDFLNAPRHSLDVLEAAHERHPDITFDATIKVSHILDHSTIWEDMAGMNLLFVISAFESVDDETLEVLDKGHTVGDMSRAVDIVRSASIHIRPTWLPFVPWTEPDHIEEMFRFIDRHRLRSATDPVQMAIKLLIPRGSLLESHPRVVPYLAEYDASALSWSWRFENPETGLIHKELERIAAAASDCGQSHTSTLAEMTGAVEALTGSALGEGVESTPVPRLTESWFCCAEPTQSQVVSLGIGPGRHG